MTQFEFVQVTLALILGLGLTDILRNLGEQLRRRNTVAIYPLQVLASCLLLLVILAYLWFFWQSVDVAWTLPVFLLQAGPAIALALSAQLIRVDTTDIATPREQYFRNCRLAYASWAVAPLLGIAYAAATDTSPALDVVRITIIVLLLSLCVARNPVYHGVVLVTLTATAVIGPLMTQFQL